MSAQAHRDRRFERTPANLVALWLLGLAGLALAALAVGLALGTGGGSSFSGDAQAWLLRAAAWLLLPVPFFTLDRLQAQRRVWLGRVAPRGLWQSLLGDHRQDLLASWAVIALPLLVWRCTVRPAEESWPQTLLAVTSTGALLAGLLGTALITAAGFSRILSPRWAALGGVGLGALLAAGPGLTARSPGSGQDVALACTLAALNMALPGLALRHLEGRLAIWRMGTTGMPPSWWTTLAALGGTWSERWRLLDGSAKAGVFWTSLTQLPLNLLTSSSPDARYLQPWGSTVTAGHGLRLGCCVLLALVSLRCLDMHWRVHLLPGGSDRRWLGMRVIGATLLTVLLPLVAALATAWLILTLFVSKAVAPGWATLPVLIASHAPPLLADLCLAVAVAAWVRARWGVLEPHKWTAIFFALAALGLLYVLSKPWSTQVLWTRGYMHHAAELALAAWFAVLANRAWKTVDLGGLLRGNIGGRHRSRGPGH